MLSVLYRYCFVYSVLAFHLWDTMPDIYRLVLTHGFRVFSLTRLVPRQKHLWTEGYNKGKLLIPLQPRAEQGRMGRERKEEGETRVRPWTRFCPQGHISWPIQTYPAVSFVVILVFSNESSWHARLMTL